MSEYHPPSRALAPNPKNTLPMKQEKAAPEKPEQYSPRFASCVEIQQKERYRQTSQTSNSGRSYFGISAFVRSVAIFLFRRRIDMAILHFVFSQKRHAS